MDCCSDLPVELPPNSQAAAHASPSAGGLIPSACAPRTDRAYHIATVWRDRNLANLITGSAGTLPNFALERSVTGFSERAAGAQTMIAPAARRPRLARPAQRGR